jgi:chromosome partitioning protein
MRAADSFIEAVRKQRNVVNRDVKLATVANRVRENTIVSHSLATYLHTLKLPDGKKFPCHAVLRASQNYIRAAERGLSLFEFAPAATQVDREHWMPLLRWLGSARSRPQG